MLSYRIEERRKQQFARGVRSGQKVRKNIFCPRAFPFLAGQARGVKKGAIGHAPVKQRLRQEVLTAERTAVIGLRDQGRIDDETLRLVERELDLEEQRLQD